MHPSLSYIRSVIERVRTTLDVSRVDGGKYNDAFILNYMVSTSMTHVLSRLSHTSGCRMLQTFTLTPVAGQTVYELPPCVEAVHRLEFLDRQGVRAGEIQPFSPWSANGQGWRLEGTPGLLRIVFDSTPDISLSMQIVYVSNGDWLPHLGNGTLASPAAGLQQLSLGTTPTLGLLDRRPSAYLGSHVRILSAGPNPIQERVIKRHWFESGAWKIEFDETEPALTGTVEYEVTVPGFVALHHACAMLAAYDLSVSLNVPASKQGGILTMYKTAMKTAGDNLTHINRALGFYMERNVPGSPASLTFGKN